VQGPRNEPDLFPNGAEQVCPLFRISQARLSTFVLISTVSLMRAVNIPARKESHLRSLEVAAVLCEDVSMPFEGVGR
jgi:uncharacterized protein involved in high-affinity Fe2+ transport